MEKIDIKAVLCDFDNTLFDTKVAKPFFKAKPKPDWEGAYAKIPECHLYRGWWAVLNQKRKLRWGIVSGNTKGFIGRVLKYNDLELDPVVGGYVCRRRQPKTKLFEIALQHTRFNGLNRSEILYIGDEATDVEQANEFGFQSAACFWGTEEPDKLAATNPTYKLFDPKDLLEIL